MRRSGRHEGAARREENLNHRATEAQRTHRVRRERKHEVTNAGSTTKSEEDIRAADRLS